MLSSHLTIKSNTIISLLVTHCSPHLRFPAHMLDIVHQVKLLEFHSQTNIA